MNRNHPDRGIGELLRGLTPAVLATVARGHQGFELCEDAVQEALLAAATQWPVDGVPDNPKGWLVTAASRRWIEIWRSDAARRRRQEMAAGGEPAGVPAPSDRDDSLTLLFLCCHPALTPVSQVALTLRAVGGLTTAEIARALLVPESTVAQRISRAKARIRDTGARFAMPDDAEWPARLAAVLHVLYLVFNEGYTASSGARLHRVELSAEAIRLTRQLRAELPDVGEVAGLLALMLLTDARRPARTTAAGGLVPLAEQDRSRWDRAAIAEGSALLTATLPTATIGPYQVQAAIAALHDEAPTAAKTDWPQILGLYDILVTLAPGPMVTLNRIVALAMARGPEVGLQALQLAESSLGGHYRIAAVRAHLLDLAGQSDEASAQYALAARTTLNLAERHYLEARAADVVSRRGATTSGPRLKLAGRQPTYHPTMTATTTCVPSQSSRRPSPADRRVHQTLRGMFVRPGEAVELRHGPAPGSHRAQPIKVSLMCGSVRIAPDIRDLRRTGYLPRRRPRPLSSITLAPSVRWGFPSAPSAPAPRRRAPRPRGATRLGDRTPTRRSC